MIQARQSCRCILMLIALLPLSACKGKEPASKPQELPDLNAQIHSYVTLGNIKLRTGPGTQFRTIAEIRQNSKAQVVGRDGDWVRIVSKKDNAAGYIEVASIQPATAEEQESPAPPARRKDEAVVDTQ